MNQKSKGTLEVICGSMFSGKSEELIRRIKRADLAKRKLVVFKHSFDNRYQTTEYIVSHNGNKIAAIAIEEPQIILNHIQHDTEVIGIDEIQFFEKEIVNIICQLVNQGKRVIVAGLDLDFKGMPFGAMPLLLAIADTVTKLHAICMHCGNDAHFTQRLVNGKPANFDDPIIMVGAQEAYQARCRDCHHIDKKPIF